MVTEQRRATPSRHRPTGSRRSTSTSGDVARVARPQGHRRPVVRRQRLGPRRDRGRRHRPRGRRLDPRRHPRHGQRGRLPGPPRCGVARARPSSSATRGPATSGPRSTRPSPTGRCPGSTSIRSTGSPSRPPPGSPSSTRSGPRSSRPSRSTAAPTAWPCVTGLDEPRVYATFGTSDEPALRRHRRRRRCGEGRARSTRAPSGWGSNPLPGLGSLVAYDEASQMVHILGLAPDAPADGPWTVYVVEPHGNAVFADARLPGRLRPVRLGRRLQPRLPVRGPPAAPRLRPATAPRPRSTPDRTPSPGGFPGVIAGALTLGLLYLLARILFRRRLVAGLVGLFVLFDGMFFVQSRIGMNDVYVGLFIVAAYTVFAAVWTGWWRGRGGVLDRHAGHRRPARARAREQVGRRLRHRRAAAAHPRAQRARPGAGDPRADRADRGPRLHGHQRAGRRRPATTRVSAT